MTDADDPRPLDDEPLRGRIRAFLAEHTTLTLATYSPDCGPAAAAVFYAADDRLNLYFLSEETTEHGRNLLANGQAAGTIHADGQDWRAIQGLQLRGAARLVTPVELPQAVAVYGRRFAFVAALLAGRSGPAVLAGPLARARFWVLQPQWFRLIDNTVRFGYRQELHLEATE